MGWVSYGLEDGPDGPVRFIPEHVDYPPVYVDAGFYLFVAAAIVALIGFTALLTGTVGLFGPSPTSQKGSN